MTKLPRPRGRLAAVCTAAVAWVLLPAQAVAAPAKKDRAQEAIDRAAAKEAVARAQASARSGDWAAALAEYERALALRPAPKLHYNIAVCHQHLAAQTQDPEARNAHLRAAIEAYNRYLRLRPDAPDAEVVEQTIVALGGVPDRPGHWEAGNLDLFDPDAPRPRIEDKRRLWDEVQQAEASPPEADQDGSPPPRPPPPTADAPAPDVPRVALAGHLLVASLHPRDATAAGPPLDRPLALGAEFEAVALLGRRRRAYVGGSAGFVWPVPIRTAAALRVAAVGLAAAAGAWLDLGRQRRVALQLGGAVGVHLELLRREGTARVTPCGAPDGRTEDVRAALSLEARPALAMQLGPDRRHALLLGVRPALWVAGSGQQVAACSPGDPPPFEDAGLPPGAAFAVMGTLGYRARF